MQKREFEEMIEHPVSDAEYRVIETVYQWHPSVKEVSGKEEVAGLYKSFGMAIFHDMLPRAEKNHELENKLRHAQVGVERIKAEMEELSNSAISKNVCVMDQDGMDHTVSGLDVVEPRMYEIFLNMSVYEFSRFIKNWIRGHLEDDSLCVGQVERMFQTPVSIYKQQFNPQGKR